MITDNPWLTPQQKTFLDSFFAHQIGRSFFLTGGTALAAFYLRHRVSIDLDLFTLDDFAITEGARLLPVLTKELGWSVLSARHTEHFHRFLLQDPEGVPLQVDLVRDFGPQFGERQVIEGIVVDSLENIAANKLTAILGRAEPKDFIDLYFILHQGWSLDTLIKMAQEKDTGLTPFYLAGALLQVRTFTLFPETTPPVQKERLVRFFLDLADHLLDQSRPTVETL